MFRLSLFLLFLGLLPLSGQTTLFRDVVHPESNTRIEITSPFSTIPWSGFYPVRVTLANNQPTKLEIKLTFDSATNFYRSDLKSKATFSFLAESGKTREWDLLVPLVPATNAGPSLSMIVQGPNGKGQHYMNSSLPDLKPAVLLSNNLHSRNASKLASSTPTSGRSSSAEFASALDTRQLPDNWLAYSGFDSVVLTDEEWNQAPAGGKSAVLSWVQLGGQLLVYTPSGASATSLGLPETAGLGTIEVLPVDSSFDLNAAETIKRIESRPEVAPFKDHLRSNYYSRWPLQTHFGSKPFRYGIFVGALCLFAVVVGPVNLFVFAKSGQRHKLFITTPIISLAASLILILLIILHDGFGGRGYRLMLMHVSAGDGANAAHIQQEQFCRTGILSGSSFTLDTPTFLTPVAIAPSRWSRFSSSEENGTFNIQQSGGKLQASGDWFQSRSEHGHALATVVPTRGRIEHTASPDELVSTFDFPIERILYQDSAGQWYAADNVATGKSFRLAPLEVSMALQEVAKEGNSFTPRNRALFTSAAMRPGCFVAISHKAPGIETNHRIKWEETKAVITGSVFTP